MQREQILKLTLDERLRYFGQLLSASGGIPEDLLDLYQRATVLRLADEDRLSYFNHIRNTGGNIPEYLSDLYKMAERAYKNKQLAVEMEQLKAEWVLNQPNFKKIWDHMRSFETNNKLIEFRKRFPGESLHNRVITTYKKCISYRQKFSKKIQNNLTFSATTPTIFYEKAIYCIDRKLVYCFLSKYLSWRDEIYPYWNKVYNEVSLFREKSEFHVKYWRDLVKISDQLAKKSQYINDIHDEVLRLLDKGSNLLYQLDDEITLAYNVSRFEMSLYEREVELARLGEGDFIVEESHCYVYTLECELCVFYVGIAADTKERLDQHIRGAFSDESHLLKSKFIQKYHKTIKQTIIFEGTRRECRQFERDYIAKHRPLGNMTEGGEG